VEKKSTSDDSASSSGSHSARGGATPAGNARNNNAEQQQHHRHDDGDEEEGEYVEAEAKAMFDYEAANDTELAFKAGDVLLITEQDSSGWWYAELNGKQGFIPNNYVELIEK